MKERQEPELHAPDAGEPKSGDGQAAQRDTQQGSIYDWVQTVVWAMVLCILIFVFCGRTVGVVGSSMEQTLLQGDRLIISRLFFTPKYGDIVVLRKDTFKEDAIIKRVIATEGQRVRIDFSEGVVYVDGRALDEPYTNSLTLVMEDMENNEEILVPEGCVFVMGDNRNRSTDSRTASIGCVDTRYIIGKAWLRILPFGRFGSIY